MTGVSTGYRVKIDSNREYIIDIPANYDNTKPYKLVFAYHWVGGSDTIVGTGGGYCNDPQSATPQGQYYGLKSLDTGNTTIFVAPNGLNAGWGNGNQADVTFTDDMLTQIEGSLCIDKSRIFSLGFSYGASMTYTLACARPTVFRAVAVLDGGQISNPPSPCNQPVAYLGIHGVSDTTFAIGSTGEVMRNKFLTNDGCTAATVANVAAGTKTHSCSTYSGCSAGHPVEWCSFDGIHQACEYDGGGGDSVQKTWMPAEVWKFFGQF